MSVFNLDKNFVVAEPTLKVIRAGKKHVTLNLFSTLSYLIIRCRQPVLNPHYIVQQYNNTQMPLHGNIAII